MEALWRLEALALTGAQAPLAEAVRRLLRSAVHFVVHTARKDGRRVVSAAAVGEGGVEVRYRC